MDSQKRESTNLDNASPLYEVEQIQTTENLKNEIENEFSVKPENNLDPKTTTTANVGLTSPCDIHFPKTIEVTNCSEYNNCDKVDDKMSSPDKQDYVNVIEIEPNIQAENIDKETEKGANDQISDKEEIVMDTVVNLAQINNCSSPVKKKLKNAVQSPNASIQEVLNKVNELDLVDRPEVLTKMPTAILKHETASLRSLLMYHSESSDNEDEEFDSDWQFQVFPDSSSDDTDSEFDAQECVVEISEDEDNPEFVLPNNKNTKRKEKQDCEPFDPPIDLSNIEVDYANEQFTHIGHITNFIGATVTIDALTNSEPYNLETVLFIDDKTSKKPVGAITDVIGPVSQPVYCVQLHDSKDIESLGLKVGMKIYSAPKSSYTKYVFLKDLLRLKGSDASWIGDEEVPSEAESSEEEDGADDSASRKRSHNNSLERHKKFEIEKNRCNVIKTKVAKLVDKCRKRGAQNVHIFPHGFNPSIPPPNMQPNLFGNAKVAPLPAPHQSTLNQLRYMRHSSRFHSDLHPQFPRFGSPNDYFTNNVGYYHNVAGPSHQNH